MKAFFKQYQQKLVEFRNLETMDRIVIKIPDVPFNLKNRNEIKKKEKKNEPNSSNIYFIVFNSKKGTMKYTNECWSLHILHPLQIC